ncbi:Protein-associating with the carboxyl-terminal domain of ezrin [Actinomortierella ambigua]|uniref:Protein-associating with the carboxyl-terminal domain of ezrin n=1 Tax=Actinomortierella ambigua TaxID=1343610 RepID=A0A9P6UBW6_9FUNG|nr:Protein-associating with the carboxyl-terminal domain of ezrin [Actinomortierella ambigua]
MGASESKLGAEGASPSSKSKLTFVPGAPPLCKTPICALRDAFYGKRPVSAFTYDPAQLNLGSRAKNDLLPKAIKKLMTIRHPSVLRFIDCKTDASGVHLITEQVRPLTIDYLEEISRDEILLGLHDILVALHFLHSQCHSRHNNIHLGSIFVTNGRWVLGGMELTGPLTEPTDERLANLLPKELIPPEHRDRAKAESIDRLHASDIWQLGMLIEGLIQQDYLDVPSGSLPLEAMINPDPRKRPTGDVLLESPFFTDNTAIQLVRFARLKGLEKAHNAEWADRIVPTMQQLPQDIVANFVIPQVLTQEFFAAEGFDTLYRLLFTPQPAQPLVSEELYRSEVLPFMVKLWNYRQADIRLTIFRLFEVYLKAVVLGEGGSEVLGQVILPEIMLGLQDTDPKIYVASLSGLATTVPYALLVQTSLVDVDTSKTKFSIKVLYEQTLIPHIMAFWISPDSNPQTRSFLLDVVVNMWSSIYSLGLQGQPAVKDMSATLTVTLVSLLKLSPIPERVDHIRTSFTNHCSSGPFCISGLLKFLPQLLLDEDVQVREAAAAAIASVAQQTILLASQADPISGNQGAATDGSSSGGSAAAASPNAHTTRIRQYCERQQALLPTRRPIFSKSVSNLSERNLSRVSSGRTTPKPQDTLTELSSRRSSMVSQDSFFLSDPAFSKSPAPSRSNTLFATETSNGGSDNANGSLGGVSPHSSVDENEHATREGRQTLKKTAPLNDASTAIPHSHKAPVVHASMPVAATDDALLDDPIEPINSDQELLRALEQAKAEMKMRQLATEQQLSKSELPKQPTVVVSGHTSSSRALNTSTSSLSFAASNASVTSADNSTWGFDDKDGDDGWGDADEAFDSSDPTAPASVPPSAEEEAKKKERERAQAERQEALRLKREQKQQELQAKREARKQQMAQKQAQKKATTMVSTASHLESSVNGGSAKTSRSNSVVSNIAAEDVVSARSPHSPSVTGLPLSSSTRQANSLFVPQADNDEWGGMEDDLDIGFSTTATTTTKTPEKTENGRNNKQLKQAKTEEEDNLFKDLQVEYKRPLYVGPSSSASSTTSLSSNRPSSSEKPLRQPSSPFAKSAVPRAGQGSIGTVSGKPISSTSSSPTLSKASLQSPSLNEESTNTNVTAVKPLSTSLTSTSLAPAMTEDGSKGASSLLAVQTDAAADDAWGDDWE